jgi:protocatechuate 3,4-dioxygenase beta subunit
MLIHGMDRRRGDSPLLTVFVCFALAIGLGAVSPLFAAAPGGALTPGLLSRPLRSGSFSPPPTARPSLATSVRPAGAANGSSLDAVPSAAQGTAGSQLSARIQQAGGISGFVLDTTNTPIPGVTVELRDASQNLLDSTVTDASGQYEFGSVVSGGTYVVRVVPPSGDTVQQVLPSPPATASGSSAILITNFNPSASYVNENFVLGTSSMFPPPPSGSISGSVIQDVDSNGFVDAGDAPIPGVQVLLQAPSGATLASATTDTNGAWAFTSLSPGTYQIAQVVPASFAAVAAFPGPGGTALTAATLRVTISNGASGNNNFLDRSAVVSPTVGTISGSVFQDVNGDGAIDDGDTPLPGVTIQLFTQSNTFIAQTRTDVNGAYAFTNIPPGFYQVVQLVPRGVVSVSPTVLAVTAVADVNQGGNNFLDAASAPPQNGTVSGSVFQDINGSGGIDAGDAPIAGVSVLLETLTGAVLAQSFTDANGAYAIANVPPGTYRIVQQVPANFAAVAAFPGPGGTALSPASIQVTIANGGSSAGNNFLDQATVVSPTVGTISGSVFQDVNGTGVIDAGDTPLPGVTIQLFTQLSTFVAQTTTDVNGAYSFTNVPPGFYQVVQLVPAGLVSVAAIPGVNGFPVNGSTTALDVTVMADVNSGNNNFLDALPLQQFSTISGSVVRDIDGNGVVDVPPDVPIPGVQVLLQTLSGTTLQTFTTDVNGAWAFRNLAPGTYRVVEIVPANFTAIGAFAGPGGVAVSTTALQVTVTGNVSGNNNFLDRGTVVSPTVGTISGSVIQDVNGTGVIDVGDLPIPGVQIRLFTQGGAFIAQTATDVNGAYAFINVPPGFYLVQQLVPAGLVNVSPTLLAVTAAADVNQGNNNFLDRTVGTPTGANTISGFAIRDLNVNGIADSEPGLASMQVTISDSFGNPLASVVTDGTGIFRFTNVPLGTFTLTATPPVGLFSTNALPGQGGTRLSANSISVTTTAGVTDYPGQLFLAGP